MRDEKRAIEMFLAGSTLQKIHEECEIPYSSLSKFFKKNGITREQKSNHPRKKIEKPPGRIIEGTTMLHDCLHYLARKPNE